MTRLSLAAVAMVFLVAGAIQPTVIVPAGHQVVLEGEAGLFMHGWSDGAHGSDWRHVDVPACEPGQVEIVTITNTSATQDVLTKYYWNPRRLEGPRGDSPLLVATPGCRDT